MSDISITAANVIAGTDAVIETGKFGATVVAGKVLYLDSTTKAAGLADANAAGAQTVRGIALDGGGAGQPGAWIRSGDLTLGAVSLTPGDPYYLSATAGGICPKADLATGMEVVEIGYAKSATVLHVDISVTGVTL